jgi:PIN domain nuclease of toxin-antitoxin system
MGNIEVILLDTHVVLWLVLDPDKLSKKAAVAIGQAHKANNGIAVSIVSQVEIAYLIARGRIRTVLSMEQFLQDLESRFIMLPLNTEIAGRAALMPVSYPRDPMDRIIGATAIVEGLPLVTADTHIQASKAVATIW